MLYKHEYAPFVEYFVNQNSIEHISNMMIETPPSEWYREDFPFGDHIKRCEEEIKRCIPQMDLISRTCDRGIDDMYEEVKKIITSNPNFNTKKIYDPVDLLEFFVDEAKNKSEKEILKKIQVRYRRIPKTAEKYCKAFSELLVSKKEALKTADMVLYREAMEGIKNLDKELTATSQGRPFKFK